MSTLAAALSVAGTRSSGASVRTQNGELQCVYLAFTNGTRGAPADHMQSTHGSIFANISMKTPGTQPETSVLLLKLMKIMVNVVLEGFRRTFL